MMVNSITKRITQAYQVSFFHLITISLQFHCNYSGWKEMFTLGCHRWTLHLRFDVDLDLEFQGKNSFRLPFYSTRHFLSKEPDSSLSLSLSLEKWPKNLLTFQLLLAPAYYTNLEIQRESASNLQFVKQEPTTDAL